jgi:hypothetical protein
MERKAVVICSVVGFLGLLSAATGFSAEGTRIKVNKNRMFMWVLLKVYLFLLNPLMGLFFIVVLLLCLFNLALVDLYDPSPLIGC